MLKKISAFIMTLLLGACSSSFDESHSKALAKVSAGAILIDVRSAEEFDSGHIDGALNIPHTVILKGVKELGINQDADIVLYCRSGNRSGQATATLQKAGFKNITNAGAYASLAAAQQQN